VRLGIPLVALALALLAGNACQDQHPSAPAAAPAAPAPATRILSIVGTSDIHGHVLAEAGRGGFDVFAGYLDNLAAARRKDGGGLVLVDAGDMMQGTLESNLGEGAGVIEVMNALHYDAASVGNHEFDFGPVGEAATPQAPGDDPRGALMARAKEARFPFLSANIRDASGKLLFPPTTIIERAGIKIGLIGVTTADTLHTTMAGNVVGLTIAPLAATIDARARALRRAGAQVVIVMAHAGGKCAQVDRPDDASSCAPDEEIMKVIAALSPGLVDVIVAGHTHQGMAVRLAGIAVVQAYANGKTFSRVDLALGPDGKVRSSTIFPPRDICAKVSPGSERCDGKTGKATQPAVYERSKVVPHPDIRRLLAPDLLRAEAARKRPLGVTLDDTFKHDYDEASAEGNLFADMTLAGAGPADAALQNGGGLRADLPAGPLTYGALFLAYPFDNRVARVTMTGAQLGRAIRHNLGRSSGILSLAGIRAVARCRGSNLEISLSRIGGAKNGKKIGDDE
jgi:5'-nucleotidase